MKYEENFKYSEVTEKIIKEAYFVYNKLGYGFLEKVYENVLLVRLKNAGFNVKKQYPINVYFENELVGEYFANILIEEKGILELKASEKLSPLNEVQLVNYLKATGIEVGLLINFGPKMEIKRKVFSFNHNNHKESASIKN